MTSNDTTSNNMNHDMAGDANNPYTNAGGVTPGSTGDIGPGAPAPTNIRYRIVGISVLMAFSLYLCRVCLGEIVKSDSFNNDVQLRQDVNTRFDLVLTAVGSNASQVTALATKLGGLPAGQSADLAASVPVRLKEMISLAEAEEIRAEFEQAGATCETKISKKQIGNILGVFFFTYALLQVPAGWISDRFGARRMLTFYILMWAVLTGLTGMITSSLALLMARLGVGVAQAGAYPTSSAAIRRWFSLDRRGRASSLISFGGRLGGTLAPFVTTMLIIQLGGWRETLWAYGITGALVAFGYWWIVRDRPADHPDCNEQERALIGKPADDRRPEAREVMAMLAACCRSRSLWLNSLLQFCINVGWAFLITWLPTYLKETKGVPESRGAMMVSAVLAMGMVGQLIGGWATDWSVRKFGLRRGRVIPISVACYIAGCCYLACLALDSVWGILACFAIVSLMTDIGNPSTWAFMQDVGGRNTGAVFGWGNMWGNFGAYASAMMFPMLLSLGGSNQAGATLVFMTCAAAFLTAGTAALGMDATKPLKPRVQT